MDPTSYKPTIGVAASEAAGTVKELQSEIKSAFEPKSKSEFEEVLKRLATEITAPKPAPGGNKHIREINMQGISAGKDGEINIRLSSGGGFSTVTLTKEGAKFTMNTPAYFQNAPGVTTQNVLEFDVDFSDLSPKKHAQLVNELRSALSKADSESHKKSEGLLIDQALEILNSEVVCKECTMQSAIDVFKEKISELLADVGVDVLDDCKKGFDAMIPEPVSKPDSDVYRPKSIVDVYTLTEGGSGVALPEDWEPVIVSSGNGSGANAPKANTKTSSSGSQ